MQAAGNLVVRTVELSTGMQNGKHDFDRRLALRRVHVDGDAAPVVADGERTVIVDDDVDHRAVTGKSFVNRVVHHFVHEMVVAALFTGEIYQTWAKEALILDEDGNELRLPKSEQIPGEHFKKNDVVKAIIKSVEMRNNTTPYIVLSRTSPEFLEKLFEQEVPEIYDGLITIKKVVRVPGERAKVAVESYDERIDPIGACIGVKGSRIIGIVRELRNENIDVLQWTNNAQLLIQRALNPAKISKIILGGEEDKIKVYMLPDEVKKGIGKGGCNIRLAGMLVGKEIEVWRELPKNEEEDAEEDVLLSEFDDVIDMWIIEKLQSIGCDTAKSVLALSAADIAKRADLEDETVEEILDILRAEFEDE